MFSWSGWSARMSYFVIGVMNKRKEEFEEVRKGAGEGEEGEGERHGERR